MRTNRALFLAAVLALSPLDGVAGEKQIVAVEELAGSWQGSYRSLTTGGASTEGKFYLQDGKLLYRSSRTTGTASLSEDQGKTVLRVMPADPPTGPAAPNTNGSSNRARKVEIVAVDAGTPQNQSPRYPRDREAAIRVVMMPRDTNPLGTIFGGVILSYIDIAAAIEAHRHYPGRVVTIAMDQVVFKQPVFVGDLVSFFTETRRVGTTSVSVKVAVWAQRFASKDLSPRRS